eukprot:750701-Hanusia_phi.AAC.3
MFGEAPLPPRIQTASETRPQQGGAHWPRLSDHQHPKFPLRSPVENNLSISSSFSNVINVFDRELQSLSPFSMQLNESSAATFPSNDLRVGARPLEPKVVYNHSFLQAAEEQQQRSRDSWKVFSPERLLPRPTRSEDEEDRINLELYGEDKGHEEEHPIYHEDELPSVNASSISPSKSTVSESFLAHMNVIESIMSKYNLHPIPSTSSPEGLGGGQEEGSNEQRPSPPRRDDQTQTVQTESTRLVDREIQTSEESKETGGEENQILHSSQSEGGNSQIESLNESLLVALQQSSVRPKSCNLSSTR